MKYATKEIILHFLKEYESSSSEKRKPRIHPFLKDFLTRSELIDIIKQSLDRVYWKDLDLEQIPLIRLWHLIADDRLILSYIIQVWEKQLESQERICPQSVQQSLQQLSAEAHYLGQKPIPNWDAYDHANYRSILLKTGRIKCLFGIYANYVSQEQLEEEEEINHPNRFFDTQKQAQEYLNELINEGKTSKEEVDILYVYRAV